MKLEEAQHTRVTVEQRDAGKLRKEHSYSCLWLSVRFVVGKLIPERFARVMLPWQDPPEPPLAHLPIMYQRDQEGA